MGPARLLIDPCRWFFAQALRIYPAPFRHRFGPAMLLAFDDGLEARVVGAGVMSACRFAARATIDSVLNGLAERRLEARRRGAAEGPRAREPWTALAQDLKSALRVIRRRPGGSTLTVLTFAVGIGAATTVFSLVDATLLRAVDLPDPGRLVVVMETYKGAPRQMSFENLADVQRQSRTLEALTAFRAQSINLTGLDTPDRVRGAFVTSDLFAVARVRPAMGRPLQPQDDLPNAPAAVVLNHEAWVRHFAGAPDVVGRSLQLNNVAFTVAGVMPEGFRFPLDAIEVWVPVRFAPASLARDARNLVGIGRMAPGTTLEAAQSELTTVAAALGAAAPDVNREFGLRAFELQDWLTTGVKDQLAILFGLVLLLLAAACASVSGLQIGVMSSRRAEVAVRAALGAGRKRLARQLLTEHLLLALAGGLGGWLVAWALVPYAVAGAPQSVFGLDRASIDGRVGAFLLFVTIGAGLVSGVLLAWQSGRESIAGSLAGSGRSAGDPRGARLRRWLVASQVAMAAMLLTIGGLLVRSYVTVAAVEPGFSTDRIFTLEYRLPVNKYRTPESRSRFHEEVAASVARLPGVTRAAVVRAAPLSGNGNAVAIQTDRSRPGDEPEQADLNTVTDDYFRALQIPLLKGRTFDARDTATAPVVVVVSRAFAERSWPGEDAIGREITPVGLPIKARVIGIVGDVRHRALTAEVQPTIYVRNAQNPDVFMTLVAVAERDALALADPVRRAIWQIDPEQPVWKVRTLESLVEADRQTDRFLSATLVILSGASLVLVIAGLYGVMSQSVTARAREIGVRMALGADRGAVLRGVLRSGLRLTAAGLVAGGLGALIVARLVRGLLYHTSPFDPVAYVFTAVVLGIVSVAACYLPAHRAARVDPVRVLK